MIAHLRHFLQDWINSLNQYPGAYLIALYTTIIWILFIYYEPVDTQLWEILTTCGIVLPLMISGALIAQIRWYNTQRKRISQIIAFVLWIWFYLYLHSLDIFNNITSVDSDSLFMLLSYIMARCTILWTIVWSTNNNTILTRWRIKEFLINILIAIVSSLILWWGISASIGSVDYLFDVNIYYKRYQYIGVISFCIVGVSILLTNLSTTKKVDDYPAIFRFFGLYIFLPLAVIYACILLSYGSKILLTQTWPKWLISWMVIGYTIRCTIVYFLTYPLANQSWIKKIHTWYFVSILVFLPLLVGAISQRIAQYGITEQRYMIVMMTIWIAIVGIWSLIWNKKSFHLMIGWLLILACNSVYTPRSASSVSLMSQKSRLEQLLTQHNLFDGENITKQTIATSSLTGQDYNDMNQIGMIWSYISQSHGTEELAYLYNETTDFDSIKDNDRRNIYIPFLESFWYTGTFDQWYNWQITEQEIYFNINKNNTITSIDLSPYETFVTLNSSSDDSTISSWWISIDISGENKELISITKKSGEKVKINLFDYIQNIDDLQNKKIQPPIINFEQWIILIEFLNGRKNSDNKKTIIDSYEIIIFLK